MINEMTIEELISTVREYIYLSYLDTQMIEAINLYMKKYLEALDNHLNADVLNNEDEENYRKLCELIDFIYREFPDNKENNVPYPCIEIIKKENDKYWQKVESIFGAYKTPEEKNNTFTKYANNSGFAYAIGIVISTCILAISLGALLFVIQ